VRVINILGFYERLSTCFLTSKVESDRTLIEEVISMRARILRLSLLLISIGAVSVLSVTVPCSSSADKEPASHADSLSDIITGLQCEARYTEALEVARSLLETLRENPEVKPWQVGDAERLIATLEYVSGLPGKAQRELAEADRLTADIEDHAAKGEYAAGVESVRRQLEIRRRHLGEQNQKTARSLNRLAVLLMTIGDYTGARPLYDRALEVQEKALGPEHPELAKSLINLALLLKKTGDYTGARPLYERALEIREKAFGPEHPDLAKCLNKLAILLQETGDYAGARPLYERALSIREKSLGPLHPDVANSLSNLANLLEMTGDYAGARPLFEHSRAILESSLGTEHPNVANCLYNLANLLMVTGDYAGARPLFERALSIWEKTLGPEHPSVGGILNSLALLLKETGDYAGSRDLYERVLSIWRSSLGTGHPWIATGLSNLAALLMTSGDYAGARPLLEQALEIKKSSLGADHPSIATSLNDLAMLLEETADYTGARPLYEQSLAIQENTLGPEHPLVAESLQKLARLLWCTGDIAMAENYLLRAAEVFEVARLRVGTGFVRATFQSSPYSELTATRLALGKTDEAWPSAEKALGRALADLLIASDRRSLSPSEAAREDSLEKTLGELENLLVALQEALRSDTTGEASKSFEETRVRLLEAEAAWSTLQRDIASKHPVTEGQAFQLDRIQEALTGETALAGWVHVDIGVGGFVSWGYVIRDAGAVKWVRLGPSVRSTDALSPAERVRQFRDALTIAASWQERVTEVNEINSYAMDIWADWLAPLTPHLDGVENLVIIPSGPMLGIPVEALTDSVGVYMGERYTISYIPSATIHAWLWEKRKERQAPTTRTALLVGDPPFTTDHLAEMEREEQGEEFRLTAAAATPSLEVGVLRSALAGNEEMLSRLPRLPWTREEVKRAASVMPEGTVLLGPDASEQELVRLMESGRLQNFNTVHLATHALVDDGAPERSVLILSRANLPDALEAVKEGKRIYDGLLTAKEIVREWKLDAELVTLSGCRTGLGKKVAGEGYIGLAHAFLQAGALSLVVSLWRVEDRATALLMGRFYENLTGSFQDGRQGTKGKPMSRARALREAKHWLRTYTDDGGNKPFRHPVYWSGFVLIGDPG
jgi:CHAT domain-containing protein/tetratricopeptide (TPR) repeat protein